MKNKKLTFVFAVTALLSVSWVSISKAGDPAPKCEKCYRGPDGKIKCEPVPCPKK